jgi:uncharacterized membrane protein YuzA (DUF378 family)
MMKKMCGVHKVAWLLLVVGGLNWGLVGLFDFNLVMKLLGTWPIVEKAVYVLVGISAVAMLGMLKCCGKCDKAGCDHCSADKAAPMGGEKKM